MDGVTSTDGIIIAFDRLGAGPAVIVISGANCDRGTKRHLAEQLAHHFTVLNYDRRGRGDSGDTAPYTVEREIEDLQALLVEAGESVPVYGHSSGAALAVHAAAHGVPIARLVLHEPPYSPDSEERRRGRYHTVGEAETGVEVGIPVAEAVVGEGRGAGGELPGGAAVSTWYLRRTIAWPAPTLPCKSWLQLHGRGPAGPGWEVYHWIDPPGGA
jgi:alpha-beta hydrolase superfamily lysophospholipase